MLFGLMVIRTVDYTTSVADIHRQDTGAVIPGTEGITPGPGIDLSGINLAKAELYCRTLTGADFSG
jgi:uncharacterized protein YjbI with pentapeptide repeats